MVVGLELDDLLRPQIMLWFSALWSTRQEMNPSHNFPTISMFHLDKHVLWCAISAARTSLDAIREASKLYLLYFEAHVTPIAAWKGDSGAWVCQQLMLADCYQSWQVTFLLHRQDLGINNPHYNDVLSSVLSWFGSTLSSTPRCDSPTSLQHVIQEQPLNCPSPGDSSPQPHLKNLRCEKF